MGFLNTLVKISRDYQRAKARAERADSMDAKIIFNMVRIIVESTDLVVSTKNYPVKVGRYQLIEDHLIRFHNTTKHPHFVKTGRWADYITEYYNGLNELRRLDTERSLVIDRLNAACDAKRCPSCQHRFDAVPRSLVCPECKIAFSKHRVSKDLTLLITTVDKDLLVDYERQVLSLPIPQYFFEAISISDRVAALFAEWHMKRSK